MKNEKMTEANAREMMMDAVESARSNVRTTSFAEAMLLTGNEGFVLEPGREMSAEEVEELLIEACEEADIDCQGNFEQNGVLTMNRGIVIKAECGTEFNLEIVDAGRNEYQITTTE